MSTTVDNRVVEMQFENSQFEKGVRESLKTLEDLKKGLELDKATKSLQSLEDTAKGINFSGMENSLDNLNKRFSVIGETIHDVESKMLNFAMNTAKKMVFDVPKKLLFGGKDEGFSKYDTETRAIATMRNALPELDNEAGTQKIYDTLTKLRDYSDETSYSFSGMIDNMSKFIAAGVHDLDTAEMSMEGIANWAAKAGLAASDPRFTGVLRELAQGMGAGVFKKQDWKSVMTANMATEDVQKQLVETAGDMGMLTKSGEDYFVTMKNGSKLKNPVLVDAKNMAETLQYGWLTSDVFVKTMQKFADRSTDFGRKAYFAAQKARTFGDAIDAVKDSVSSGWSETFRLMFGNVDEATDLWTDLATVLQGTMAPLAEFRNGILKTWREAGGAEALTHAFYNVYDAVLRLGAVFGLGEGSAKSLGNKLADLSKGLEELTSQFGSFLHIREMFELDDIESEVSGASKAITEVTGDLAELQEFAQKASEETRGMIDTGTVKMKAGTKQTFNELADAYADLSTYIAGGGRDADELAQKIDRINQLNAQAQKTPSLMKRKLTSLKGMSQFLSDYASFETEVVTALEGREDVTSKMESAAQKEATESQRVIQENARNLALGFVGFKDFLGMFTDLFGAMANGASQLSSKLAPLGNLFLTIVGSVGQYISNLRKSLKENKVFEKGISAIMDAISPITNGIDGVAKSFKAFLSSEDFSKKLASIGEGVKSFGQLVWDGFTTAIRIASDFIAGFVSPLLAAAGTRLIDIFSNLGDGISSVTKKIQDMKVFETVSSYASDLFTKFKDYIFSEDVQNRVKGITDRIRSFADSVYKTAIESDKLKRAGKVASNFFKLLKRDPRLAARYLKNVAIGLLEPIKNSELYKKVSPYIVNFASAVKKAVTESEGFKKAQTVANNFFSLLKRDPQLAFRYLKNVGKSILETVKNSALFKSIIAPVQAFWNSFKDSWLVTRLSEDFHSLAESLQNGSFSFDLVKEKAVAFFNDLKTHLSNITLDSVIDGITTSLSNMKKQLEERGVFDSFKDQLKGGLIGLFFPASASAEGAQEGQRQLEQFGPVLKEGVKQSLIEGMEPIAKLHPFTKQVYDALFPDQGTDLLEKGITETETTIEEQTESMSNSIVERIKSVASQVYEQLKTEVTGFLPKLQGDLASITGDIDVGTTFKNLAVGIAALQGGRWLNSLRKINKTGNKNLKILTAGLADSVKMTGEGAKGMFTSIGEGIKSMFTDTGDSVKTFTSNLGNLISTANKKHDTFGTAMLKIAGAIALIAGSIWLISQIDPKQLEHSLIAMGIALAGVLVFMGLMKGLHLDGMANSMKSVGIGMLGLAVAMRILVRVIKALYGMNPDDFAHGFARLSIMLVALGIFINATKDKVGDGKSATSNLKGLIGMAIAIRLLVWSLKSLAKMDTEAMAQGLVGLGVLMTELGVFMVLTKDRASDGKTATGNLKGLIGMAIAIRILVWSLQILGQMNTGQLIQGIIGLGAVMVELALFTESLKRFGSSSAGDTIKIVLLAVALNAVVKPIQKLGKMKTGQLIKGVAALGAIMTAMGVFMKSAGSGGIKDAISSVISMATLAGFMWIFFKGLDKAASYDTTKLATFAGGISAVLLSMSAAMFVFSKIGVGGAAIGAVGLGVAGAILLAFVVGLAELVKLLKTYVNPNIVQDIEYFGDVLSAIGGAVGRMIGGIAGGIVTGFAENLDISNIATQLSTFMDELQPFLDKVGNVTSKQKTGAENLAGVLGAVSAQGFMDALGSLITGISGAEQFAKEMKWLGGGLADYSTAITDIDNPKIEASVKSLSSLAGLSDKLPGFFEILGNLVTGTSGAEQFSSDMEALGSGLSKYSSSVSDVDTGKVSASAMALSSLADVANSLPSVGGLLSFFMGGTMTVGEFGQQLQELGSGLQLYSISVSGIDEGAEKKSKTAVQLAKDIISISSEMSGTSLFGAVLTSGLGSISSGLGAGLLLYSQSVAQISNDSSKKSMTAVDLARDVISIGTLCAIANFDKLGTLKDNVGEIGANLALYAGGLSELTDGDVSKSAIARQLAADAITIATDVSTATGIAGLDTASETLRKLGSAIGVYSRNIKSVDSGEADAQHAWDLIKALVTTIPEGLPESMKEIPTSTDLDTFAGQLASLGGAIVSFATEVQSIKTSDVTKGTKALGLLGDMTDKIPKVGGLKQKLAGWTNYTSFSAGIINLGNGILSFANRVKFIQDSDVKKGTDALGLLSEMSNKIPKTDGLIEKFTGWANYDDFSAGIINMGNAVSTFSGSVKDVDTEATGKATNALSVLATIVSSELPKEGGLWQWITGNPNWTGFSNGVGQMGAALQAFDKNLGENGGINEERLLSGIRGLRLVINALNSIQPETTTGTGQGMFDRILTVLDSLPNQLKATGDTLASVNWGVLDQMMSVLGSIMLMGELWANSTADDGISNIRQALVNLATGVQGSGKWFGGVHTIPELAANLAQMFVNSLTDSFGEYEGNVKIAGGYLGQAAYDGAKAWEGDFSTIGYNFCAGLAQGIYSGEDMVWIAAHYVANEARIAAMNALDENSPSKAMFKVGMFADMGLANGLNDYASLVKQAAGDTAESALAETGSVIAEVSAMLAQGTDTTPTIRPVLDLTDITTGVAAMNGMLPGTYGMRVNGIMPSLSTARANAIGEDQPTAGSADVVDAVNSLAARLDLLEETMSSLNVVLDTGATVGGLAPAMNKEFGSQSLLDERNI